MKFPLFTLKYQLVLPLCTSCLGNHTIKTSWVQFPIPCRRHCLIVDVWSSISYDLSTTYSVVFPGLKCRAYVVDVSVEAGHLAISSLYFDQLWTSVMVSIS